MENLIKDGSVEAVSNRLHIEGHISLENVMNTEQAVKFGVIDHSFLASSIGTLNPQEPILLHEERAISDAIHLLKNNKIGCVILTNSNNELTGIFTERDVLLKIAFNGISIKTTPVKDVMTKNPETIQMTDSVAHGLYKMSNGGFRHLPIVVENRIPVGIISVKDIIDYIGIALNNSISRV